MMGRALVTIRTPLQTPSKSNHAVPTHTCCSSTRVAAEPRRLRAPRTCTSISQSHRSDGGPPLFPRKIPPEMSRVAAEHDADSRFDAIAC